MATREQTVANLMEDGERLQYDGQDSERIYKVSEEATKSFVALLQLVAEFRNEIEREVDEDSASRMKQIRTDLVTMYADALVNIHKLGATFRITGEAFDRMVAYEEGKTEALVVSDL